MSVAVQAEGEVSILKRLIAAALALLAAYLITMAQLPDRDKMFNTALSPTDVVKGFYGLEVGQQDFAAARHQFVSPDMVEHGPLSIDEFHAGGTPAQDAPAAGWPVNPADNLIVNGDVIVARYRVAQAGQTFYVVEIFKVLAGSIIEHWAVRQPAA
ncbi:MAG: hypothetical protein AB7T07_05540 [Steroidobacteraceae bacterium]